MTQWQRLAAFAYLLPPAGDIAIRRVCWFVYFVCWSFGWLVRLFVNILPTAAMAGWVAFSSCTYLLYKPSYNKIYCQNFRYHGNGGWSETNFTTTVKLLDSENPLLGAEMGVVSPIRAELLPIFCRNFQIFVAIATKVGLAQISLAQLNSPTLITPY